MSFSELLKSEALTHEQREAMRRLDAWAWCCVASDGGYRAVFLDQSSAERYATHTHGIVVPLAPVP